MKISSNSINFKGYDAAPLKNVYMAKPDCEDGLDIYNELKKVLATENIGLKAIGSEGISDNIQEADRESCYYIWNQDRMAFARGENNKTEVFGLYQMLPYCTIKDFQQQGITPVKEIVPMMEGGNFFLGTKENGEDYILAGADNIDDAQEFALEKNIKPENVHIISQDAFHLDMSIRPIGYPYVLVNDIDLVCENIEKTNISDEDKKYFISSAKNHNERLKRNNPEARNGKEIAKELEAQGFKPILIGGSYFYDVNFMNAIVHKRNDGTLCYITNSAENLGRIETELQEIFKAELAQKIPNLHSIHFIAGEKARQEENNAIQNFLISQGGIHCLCAEEPNFEILA